MMVRTSKTRIFRGFFLSYILILILPFAFGSLIYARAIGIIEKDAKDARMFMLRQSSTIVDNYLKDLEHTVFSMSGNNYLQNLMFMDQPGYGSADIYFLTQTQKDLRSYNLSTTFESSYYVFFRQGDMVLTRSDTHFGIRQFYDSDFTHSGLTYEQWYDDLLNTPHNRDIRTAEVTARTLGQPQTTRWLRYCQSLPVASGKGVVGAIVVMIRESDIRKLLSDVDPTGTGYTCILDKEGKLIAGVGAGSAETPAEDRQAGAAVPEFSYRTLGGREMAVMSVRSAYNGWTYETALPTEIFMDKAVYIRKVIAAIVLVTLLIGVVVAVILTRRNVRPIQDTLLTLRKVFKGEPSGGGNEYEFLKSGIARLVNTHEEMKLSMDQQALLMKSSFLNRLLRGEISDEEEIRMLSGHLEMDFSGSRHAAVLISLNAFEEMVKPEQLIEQDVSRMILETVIARHTGSRGRTVLAGAGSMVLLMTLEGDSEEQCEQTLGQMLGLIRADLMSSYQIQVVMGIGRPYDRVADLHLSFGEARAALAQVRDSGAGDGLIWFRLLKRDMSGYYYPAELEQQLINMARAGNRPDIARILQVIYDENFVQRTLTTYMEYNLFFDMRGTLLKAFSEMNSAFDPREVISSRYSTMSVEEVFETIRRAYGQICDEAGNRKKSHNDQLVSRLVAYIQANFFSPDVSTSQMAAEFHISESYFSQFFKEQVGETFSDYLEKLRISKACQLLTEKQLSVEDTAKLVGYNSAYSFRRAFKRVMGVVPTEYRTQA